MFYVYLVSNCVNGKIYIGYTSRPHTRWLQHKNPNNKYHGGNLLKKALTKYGVHNFVFDIIETFETKENALEAEMFWIAYMKSIGAQLYNLTNGGEDGSKFWKGKHLPQSIKDKLSISHTGKHKKELNVMYGKNHTMKVKLKISETNKKVSDMVVDQIRQLSQTGNYTGRELSAMFNISTAQISRIINRKRRNL